MNGLGAQALLPGVEAIMANYATFEDALPKRRARLDLDETLSYPDFVWVASDFVSCDEADPR